MLRRWAYFDQPRTASLPDEQLLHQPPAALGLRLGEPFPPELAQGNALIGPVEPTLVART